MKLSRSNLELGKSIPQWGMKDLGCYTWYRQNRKADKCHRDIPHLLHDSSKHSNASLLRGRLPASQVI